MSASFVAIIPARKGSKGIKNKNLSKLLDAPLLEWTLQASLKSSFISKSILSSDSLKILDLGKDYNFLIHERSTRLSQDHIKTNDVILNIFEEFPELVQEFTHFILLQPTSPLRTFKHIDEACKKILYQNASSLISVCKVESSFLKNFLLDESGHLIPSFDGNFFEMPRQELPPCFKPNGAIFISEIQAYLSAKSFLQEPTTYYEMDFDSSIDIDHLSDLSRAEEIMLANFKES